jgi:hypothetical protein
MKKQIVILIITHLLIFKGISQTSDSVTCIPNSQLKLAINKIEEGKVMKQELTLINTKVSFLEKSNSTKDVLIKQYEQKDSLNNLINLGLRDAIKNLNTSIANNELKYSAQAIKLKRQKLRKWGTLILGFGIGYLAFK